MAMPRSITVVHAGLSGAFYKTFPQISSSGTHNHQGLPSRERISRGTPGLCRPVNSLKNEAHKPVALPILHQLRLALPLEPFLVYLVALLHVVFELQCVTLTEEKSCVYIQCLKWYQEGEGEGGREQSVTHCVTRGGVSTKQRHALLPTRHDEGLRTDSYLGLDKASSKEKEDGGEGLDAMRGGR